jgi:hypothetical protein
VRPGLHGIPDTSLPGDFHQPLDEPVVNRALQEKAGTSASANTMLGDLPPSSRATCLKERAAASLIFWPARSDPVKATLAIAGCETSAAPASLPNPVTTFTSPAGNSASVNSSANSSVEADVNSDGLIMAALPAAKAAASL